MPSLEIRQDITKNVTMHLFYHSLDLIDYSRPTNDFQFSPGGPTRVCVSFIIIDDNLLEFTERFNGRINQVFDLQNNLLREADRLIVDIRDTIVNIEDEDGKTPSN